MESTLIKVPSPARGESIVVEAQDGNNFAFDFDPTQAEDIQQQGNDLVFTLADGNTVTLRDFFDFTAEEGIPEFTLPDGTRVASADVLSAFDIDVEAAAGAGAGSGGAGEYNDDPGSLIPGLARIGIQPTFGWGSGFEVPYTDQGQEIRPGGMDFANTLEPRSADVHESQGQFTLAFDFDFPPSSGVTLVFQLTGSYVDIMQAMPDGTLFRADVDLNGIYNGTLPDGVTFSYNPANDQLTVNIPAGVGNVRIPFELVDDHINDPNASITFEIIDASGGVDVNSVLNNGSFTVNIAEDDVPYWDAQNLSEAILDGPVVGLSVSPKDVNPSTGEFAPIYEGSEADTFVFQIHMKDPYSLMGNGDNYEAANDYSGFKGSNVLSQDMTVYLKPSGATVNGDYVLRP
ncbi:hypothetical protein LJC36_06095, partial [Desulfovibrio sp. OttesenSCG-928-C14]|nr:hypothetical protein [Desulfovibrio sp. OttesenSCG-928-C14]